jgi:hypothetical protein
MLKINAIPVTLGCDAFFRLGDSVANGAHTDSNLITLLTHVTQFHKHAIHNHSDKPVTVT